MIPKPEGKPKLGVRLLIGAVAGFALLLTTTVVWMAWDEKEPDLSDVLPRPRVNLQAQANWEQLRSACQAMKNASEAWKAPAVLTEGSETTVYSNSGKNYLSPVEVFFAHDHPREELEPLVSALELKLPALDAALALHGFEAPLPKTFEEKGDASFGTAAEALGTLGRFYLKFGNQEDAVRMVRRLFHLADRIKMAEGDFFTVASSTRAQHVGLNTLQHLVDSQHPTRDQLPPWIALSEQARPSAGVLAEAFRVELFKSLLLLDEVRKGYIMDRGKWRQVDMVGAGSLTRVLLRPNETRRMLGEIARLGIRQIELPITQHDSRWEMRYPIHHRLNDRFGVPRLDNLGGRLFVNVAAFPPGTARVYVRQQTTISAKQAAWAALAYQRDHQQLPAHLSELVPDYLPTVPHDHLGDEPLSYDPERGVIWSAAAAQGKAPERHERELHGISQWLVPEEPSGEDADNAAFETDS
jgi:hypothetical protein